MESGFSFEVMWSAMIVEGSCKPLACPTYCTKHRTHGLWYRLSSGIRYLGEAGIDCVHVPVRGTSRGMYTPVRKPLSSPVPTYQITRRIHSARTHLDTSPPPKRLAASHGAST